MLNSIMKGMKSSLLEETWIQANSLTRMFCYFWRRYIEQHHTVRFRPNLFFFGAFSSLFWCFFDACAERFFFFTERRFRRFFCTQRTFGAFGAFSHQRGTVRKKHRVVLSVLSVLRCFFRTELFFRCFFRTDEAWC